MKLKTQNALKMKWLCRENGFGTFQRYMYGFSLNGLTLKLLSSFEVPSCFSNCFRKDRSKRSSCSLWCNWLWSCLMPLSVSEIKSKCIHDFSEFATNQKNKWSWALVFEEYHVPLTKTLPLCREGHKSINTEFRFPFRYHIWEGKIDFFTLYDNNA